MIKSRSIWAILLAIGLIGALIALIQLTNSNSTIQRDSRNSRQETPTITSPAPPIEGPGSAGAQRNSSRGAEHVDCIVRVSKGIGELEGPAAGAEVTCSDASTKGILASFSVDNQGEERVDLPVDKEFIVRAVQGQLKGEVRVGPFSVDVEHPVEILVYIGGGKGQVSAALILQSPRDWAGLKLVVRERDPGIAESLTWSSWESEFRSTEHDSTLTASLDVPVPRPLYAAVVSAEGQVLLSEPIQPPLEPGTTRRIVFYLGDDESLLALKLALKTNFDYAFASDHGFLLRVLSGTSTFLFERPYTGLEDTPEVRLKPGSAYTLLLYGGLFAPVVRHLDLADPSVVRSLIEDGTLEISLYRSAQLLLQEQEQDTFLNPGEALIASSDYGLVWKAKWKVRSSSLGPLVLDESLGPIMDTVIWGNQVFALSYRGEEQTNLRSAYASKIEDLQFVETKLFVFTKGIGGSVLSYRVFRHDRLVSAFIAKGGYGADAMVTSQPLPTGLLTIAITDDRGRSWEHFVDNKGDGQVVIRWDE